MNENEDKRNYKFCILPNSICRTSKLNPYDKAVLIAILSCGDNAFPSYTKLCEWTGLCRQTINKVLRNLEQLELIYRKKLGRKVIYITRWQDKKNDIEGGVPIRFNQSTSLTLSSVYEVDRISLRDRLEPVYAIDSKKTHEEDS